MVIGAQDTLVSIVLFAVTVGVVLALLVYLLRYFPRKKTDFNQSYLLGLNYLLSEESDKAVDVFIKLLEVDDHTIETHLALGNLFRKRGEVDRAIRIHRNLVDREDIEQCVRMQALVALGEDYLKAGVLDRAEQVFKQVTQLDASRQEAWLNLLDIYQQEKEWSLVIEVGKKIAKLTAKEMKIPIAQAHCEIAQWRFARGEVEAAQYALTQALSANRGCVRANLLLAEYHIQQNAPEIAVRVLKRVKEQNASFLSEILPLWQRCCQSNASISGLLEYLIDNIQACPQLPIYMFFLENASELAGQSVLADKLLHHIYQVPSVAGLSLSLTLQLPKSADGKAFMHIMESYLDQLVRNHHTYQCIQCGFASSRIHWLCPGCRQWETVKPVALSASKH